MFRIGPYENGDSPRSSCPENAITASVVRTTGPATATAKIFDANVSVIFKPFQPVGGQRRAERMRADGVVLQVPLQLDRRRGCGHLMLLLEPHVDVRPLAVHGRGGFPQTEVGIDNPERPCTR